jgi:hypothetical protein
MGELSPRYIQQPEWFLFIEAAPVLNMSVEQINDLDPVKRRYWVTRAIAALNVKGEASRLLAKARSRESS